MLTQRVSSPRLTKCWSKLKSLGSEWRREAKWYSWRTGRTFVGTILAQSLIDSRQGLEENGDSQAITCTDPSNISRDVSEITWRGRETCRQVSGTFLKVSAWWKSFPVTACNYRQMKRQAQTSRAGCAGVSEQVSREQSGHKMISFSTKMLVCVRAGQLVSACFT